MEQEKYEEKLRRDAASARQKSLWSWLVIVILLLIAGGFYFAFIWQPQQNQPVAAQPQAVVLAPIKTENTKRPVPAEAPLPFEIENTIPKPQQPVLDDSNDLAIATLGQLYPSKEWLKWMTTEESLRKFVVVIDNVANGKVAQKYISIPKPKEKFKIEKIGDKEYLQVANYERYNHYLDIFTAIDTDLMVSSYRQLSPLLEEAYAELGYADKTFDTTLQRAIEEMLETPNLPEGEIELTHTSVVYKYKDEALENLSPLQKQMLRMGPRNTTLAHDKLQAIKQALNK